MTKATMLGFLLVGCGAQGLDSEERRPKERDGRGDDTAEVPKPDAQITGSHEISDLAEGVIQDFSLARVVGDVTGDGVADVAGNLFIHEGYVQRQDVAVFGGNVRGELGAQDVAASARGSGDLWDSNRVVGGDFDGDGQADLVVWHYEDGRTRLYRGPLDGRLEAQAQGPAADRGLGLVLAAADLDEDGTDELFGVVPTATGERVVGLTGGGLDPQDARWKWDAGARMVQGMVSGDLTGDGAPDLAIALWSSEDYSYLGSVAVATGDEGDLDDALVVSGGTESAYAASTVGVGDVTGDGQDDLVVAAPVVGVDEGAVYIFAGPLTPGEPLRFEDATYRIEGVDEDVWLAEEMAVADFDGDGVADIVASQRYTSDSSAWEPTPGVVAFYGPIASNRTRFEANAEISIGDAMYEFGAFAAGDVDGNGNAEVLIAHSERTWLVDL